MSTHETSPTSRRRGLVPLPLDPDLDPEETLPRHQRRFDRTARLLGDGPMARLLGSHVTILGIGGVGSFAVEALVRAGVGRLTLIDFDDVCVTNTNRQLHTTKATVGEAKVQVMAARCRLINPRIRVEPVEAFYRRGASDELLPEDDLPDFVIDAIDNITAKTHLLHTLRRRGIRFVSSMGAAARFDPTQIRVADLKDTYNDPFAKDVRAILRTEFGWDLQQPTGARCVFSIERPWKPTALHYDVAHGGFQCVCPPKDDRGHTCENRLQIEGSLGFVTGAFGLACASVAVNDLAGVGGGTKVWAP